MAMIKRLLAAALLALALPASAEAAAFSAKRGLNLDIWVTWPAESEWGNEGAVLPFPEWRKFLKASDLEALKADGFDFLRMPVDPSPFLSGKTEAFRDKMFEEVLASARMVNAAGLKVVVAVHLVPAGDSREIGMGQVMDDPALFDSYIELVRKMAKTLSKEEPTMVAFEPMNEPVVDCDEEGTNFWPERQKRLFAAARASATRLTLVLTGACFASAEQLSKVDPREYFDDNLLWTFHSYDPFLLTHQGATWAGDFIPYVTGLPYPPYAVPHAELDAALERVREKIRAEAPLLRRNGMLVYLDELMATMDTEEKLRAVMDKPFDTAAAWAKEHGVAPENILLGEFGMIRQEYGNDYVMPGKWRAAYVKDMIARAEAKGFAWSIWGYGGAFGVVEEFEARRAEPDVIEAVRALPSR